MQHPNTIAFDSAMTKFNVALNSLFEHINLDLIFKKETKQNSTFINMFEFWNKQKKYFFKEYSLVNDEWAKHSVFDSYLQFQHNNKVVTTQILTLFHILKHLYAVANELKKNKSGIDSVFVSILDKDTIQLQECLMLFSDNDLSKVFKALSAIRQFNKEFATYHYNSWLSCLQEIELTTSSRN